MPETHAERQARYQAKTGTGKIRHLADGTWVWHSTRGPLYAPTKTALKKKMASPKAEWLAGILRRQKANAAALNLARDNVDKWTKDWFAKNLNKFGIRDLNKALNQLSKDWTAELKANPAKYTHAQFTGVTETGFPKIRGATKTAGTGTAKTQVPNHKAFKFPGVGSIIEGRGEDRYIKPFLKRVFYANYLNNNPSFKNDVKNYMKYILENKSGTVNQFNLKAFREFGEKIAKPDVIHFLSPDAGINSFSRSKLLGTAFPGLYRPFQDKVNGAGLRYTEHLRNIEKKLKMPSGSIRKELAAEHKALAKIFDVSELPKSLRYSVDHQFGISEASRSKDLKFIRATLNNLRGMTTAMNEGLGWGGFSVQRKALTNQINAGLQVTKNLEKLNEITKVAYDVEGAYQLSPKNKVMPAAHFVGETQPERFGSYLKQLGETTEGATALKSQMKINPELVKSINAIPALKSMMEKRVNCADGCLAAVAKNEPAKFGKALETLPQKARGFLSLLGRGGLKAAPFAAIAGAGVLAEPLVKEFRNDDYSTYLSDPEQQGSMLLAMVEAETPKVDEEILKWQYPGMAGAAAAAIPGSSAMMKARKAKGFGLPRQALGPVGKFLAGTFSPLGIAATLPISVAAQVKGGSEIEDIATDPFNWLAPAFASSGARMATRGMAPTGILAKAIRMGMSPATLRAGSRFLGMPGLALSAGLTGYDWWKNRGKDKDDEFKVRNYKDDDD